MQWHPGAVPDQLACVVLLICKGCDGVWVAWDMHSGGLGLERGSLFARGVPRGADHGLQLSTVRDSGAGNDKQGSRGGAILVMPASSALTTMAQ
jgi:hypothetical protein